MWQFLQVVSTTEEIVSYVEDHRMEFASRVLCRRAIAQKPKEGFVYDFSFSANLLVGRFSASFAVWLEQLGAHPMMRGLDPLTYGRRLFIHLEGLTIIGLDTSKIDKRVHFYLVRQYLEYFIGCFELRLVSRNAAMELLYSLLCRTLIYTPDGSAWRRRKVSFHLRAKDLYGDFPCICAMAMFVHNKLIKASWPCKGS